MVYKNNNRLHIRYFFLSRTLQSDHHHHHYDHYEGHHGYDYGHHGGYGHHHQPVIYHSTGWHLDKHGHGWHW